MDWTDVLTAEDENRWARARRRAGGVATRPAGRSLKQLIELMGELEGQGSASKALPEAIDTTTAGGKLEFIRRCRM